MGNKQINIRGLTFIDKKRAELFYSTDLFQSPICQGHILGLLAFNEIDFRNSGVWNLIPDPFQSEISCKLGLDLWS